MGHKEEEEKHLKLAEDVDYLDPAEDVDYLDPAEDVTVGESHPDFIVPKARQFEHNTTTIMEKIKTGDIIPYKKLEDRESGYNLRMQFTGPFQIDNSKPDDINKIYKAEIILLGTDKPGTIYMSLRPDTGTDNEALVIAREFIISENNTVDIICDFTKIFQEGGKRKSNKRKTHKRKSNKRKTHKRKTHKRKTHKRKTNKRRHQ